MTTYSIHRTEKFIFSFFSILFHPLFMPFYTLFIIIHTYTQYFIFNNQMISLLLVVFLILTAILPLLVLTVMYLLKLISSYNLHSKEERISVTFMMLMFYLFTTFFFRNVTLPYYIDTFIKLLPFLMFVLFISLIFFNKLSLHLFGIGACIGTLLFYRIELSVISPFYIISSIVLIAGIVATSRLILAAHTIKQVFTGFLLGIMASYLGLYGILNLL